MKIDAQQLLDEIFAEVVEPDAYNEYTEGVNAACGLITGIINDLTAQETANWIYDAKKNIFNCSKCGNSMVRTVYNFCPWCGAEMGANE